MSFFSVKLVCYRSGERNMTIQEWFDKRKEAQIERRARDIKGIEVEAPELWTKCVHCDTQILKSELEENLMVCPHCDYHFRINATTRIKQLFDEGSFEDEITDYRFMNKEGESDQDGR